MPASTAKPLAAPTRVVVAGSGSALRGACAVLAPAATAIVALAAHLLLPDAQDSVATGKYAVVLQALLAATLVLASVQTLWKPLRPWARHYAPLCAGAIGWLCFWDVMTLKLNVMPLPYFPGPNDVIEALIDERYALLTNAMYSLRLLMTGYLGGVTLGLVSGVLMGWFADVRYWGVPVMKVAGPIPATALVPLSMVIFDEPLFQGASLIALAVWFPVTMLTMSGIANVPVSYFDVAKTLGARRDYLIFRVAIPGAMPTIFIGLFMGLSAAFLTLMVAETVGVKAGLGWYLAMQKGYAAYDKVYAILIIMSVFFSSIMTLLFKVRDWLLVWQKGMIRW